MSLPRYSKYKDSGVKWLGMVPEHWDTRRIRFLFQIKKRIAGAEGYDVLSITQQGIKIKDIESNDGQLAMDYSKYQFVEIGDFAMNHMDLLTGYVDISDSFGVTSPDYRVFSMKDPHANNDRYFLHIFQNAYRQRIFYAFGQGASHLGRWRLPAEQFQDFVLPLPSLQEQSAVASFLDQEIEKIDALTAEQRRLIELLKEKRQAVISHAITKGLNPDVLMKESGIKGMDAVPKHWEVTVIKRFSTLQRGHDLTDAERTEGRYPVVTSGGISGTHGAFKACGPGVVTGRYGSTGRLFFIEENFWPHNTSLYVSGFHGNHARFVWYALQTVDFAAHSAKSAVPGIDRNDIHVLPVVVPPHEEQLAISHFLDGETARVDSLITEATHAIDLLQERRSALISAAVTGQIDVRTYRSEASNVVALPTRKASPGFVRTVLAAEIVHQLHLEPTFGHVKFQKIFHLAQYYAEIEDFDSNYTRQAAGPFDHGLVKSVEKQMRNAKWYDCQRDGGRYYFSPMEKAGGHDGYFTSYYGAKRDKIQHIIDLCRKMTTEQCEIVSTLYGGWNDLLLAGSAVTDDVIVHEVLTHWHSAKERIDESRWKRALGWMRGHDLTPKGKGKPIKTRVAEART